MKKRTNIGQTKRKKGNVKETEKNFPSEGRCTLQAGRWRGSVKHDNSPGLGIAEECCGCEGWAGCCGLGAQQVGELMSQGPECQNGHLGELAQ
eukprot:6472393-Amphidinium_carterae.1